MTLDKHDKWGMDKNKKKKAPFVAFYDMRAVTFVLPDEMADVMVLGLRWFKSYTLNDKWHTMYNDIRQTWKTRNG